MFKRIARDLSPDARASLFHIAGNLMAGSWSLPARSADPFPRVRGFPIGR